MGLPHPPSETDRRGETAAHEPDTTPMRRPAAPAAAPRPRGRLQGRGAVGGRSYEVPARGGGACLSPNHDASTTAASSPARERAVAQPAVLPEQCTTTSLPASSAVSCSASLHARRGYISAISRLYRGYIAAVSRLYLGCISDVSRRALHARRRLEPCGRGAVSRRVRGRLNRTPRRSARAERDAS